MNFVIQKQLTNARPPKSNEPELITTPTAGNMRLTEAGAGILGVKAGDYVGVVEASKDGKVAIFLHKGWADEANGNVGSKLSSPNDKMGGSLLFSSAYAYNTLGGNSQTNRHYTIATEAIEQDKVKYFELNFTREVDKIERTPSEEAEANA